MPRPLVIGNWKMNAPEGADAIVEAVAAAAPGGVDLAICPPATLVATLTGRGVEIGGQDCHAEDAGAHTGDISAPMLAAAGASLVIVGHSERRADHGESDAMIAAKAAAAHRAGLIAVICVGETLAQRDAGAAESAVLSQLAGSLPDGADAGNTVIAYEPVWAIGTGRVAAPEDVAAMHARLREAAPSGARLLYGGSVKPGNAAELFALDAVDGGLIGGASLNAADFLAIAQAAASSS